ncbi:MAG: valine--tRNA ligase [Halobacteria archaeon]
MDVPKNYDPGEVEDRWRERWSDDIYEYQDSGSPDYVIDTPPPYPTGNLHIGNALGWCYMDYVARFKRLQGYDVLFPQGWDCHGLPTEVKVEENNDITKADVSRTEFRDLCVEHTYEMIDEMRQTMDTLGFSQDWSNEYITMEPEYWGKTQRSFVEMVESDFAYRGKYPVNWCPRCGTAIADAEVEREDRDGSLVYLEFPVVSPGTGESRDGSSGEGDAVEIATTRPELLAACGAVAVDPEDERFSGYVGDTVEVPLFGQEVEVIADEEVDPEFGTGAVMICTFGDKQDVEWWAEYDLELRTAFSKQGTLTDVAGEYEGLSIEEAKQKIAEDLEEEGYLYESEPLEQSVGVCWRCDTPIEILAEEQWFIEVDQDEILGKAREVDWIPEHAYDRLEDWTESMEWDWVISRQRIFATPFPVWYCNDCGEPYVASVDELPVDPHEDEPAENCVCGSTEFEAETDVMDTWMDSSISAMYVAGWPDEFEPTQLREQGHDIIRTWAFYTILRTAALEDEIPWEDALVNGMVFGDDGHKMSKSRGNFVQPEEVIEEYGADAFRQSMASAGRPGSDIQFQWKEVERADKFQTKLWNIYRFAIDHVSKESYGYDPDEPPELRVADEWILGRLSEVSEEAEELMDDYRFDLALQEVREFTWNEVADDYVELVKGRLYESPEGSAEHQAVRWTLRTVLEAVTVMISPIAPFFAEELYRGFNDGSVNEADWPEPRLQDPDVVYRGNLQAEAVAEVRRWKSEEGMALNQELDKVEIYTEEELDPVDVGNTLNAETEVLNGEPELEEVPSGVDPDMSVLGPEFRGDAGKVAAALEERDPGELESEIQKGEVVVEVDGEDKQLDPESAEVVTELRSGGKEVEVFEVEDGDARVVVFP